MDEHDANASSDAPEAGERRPGRAVAVAVSAGRPDIEYLLRLVSRQRLPGSRGHRDHEEFLATFKDFPPRQRAASFTIDQAEEKLEAVLTTGH
jgi:hypothetical protein